MADIVTNTLQIGNDNLILRDADAQEQITSLKEDLSESVGDLKSSFDDLNQFCRKEIITEYSHETSVTAGSTIGSTTHIIDANIPYGKQYTFRLNATGFSTFTLYVNGDTSSPINGISTNTDHIYTASTHITYFTIYKSNIGATETIKAIVSFSTETSDSLEERIEDLENVELVVNPKDTTFFKPSPNLFDFTTAVGNELVVQTNGNFVSINGYTRSDYISVASGEKYCFVKFDNSTNFDIRYAFYDQNKTFISGGTGIIANIVPIIAPENAHFMAFSCLTVNMPIMVYQGDSLIAYCPFDFTYIDPQYVVSENPDDIILNLPEKIYATTGFELNIYFENLTDNWDKYHWDVSCPVGKQMERGYTITPTDANAGTKDLIITASTDDGIIKSVNSKLIITTANYGSGVTKSVIVLGDSTTANGIAVTKLNNNFANLPMNIETLGTLGTSPNNHEGRSGWTFNLYFTSSTDNVFYNPSSQTFDASYYFTNTGVEKPDWFVINLGINDTFNYSTDLALERDMETIIGLCDQMITSIKAASPNSRIGVCITIPPNHSQDAFGKSYNCNQTRDRYKRNNALWAKRQIKEYDGRESEGIYLIPIHTNLDTIYNMGLEDVQVNARNTATYKSPIGNGTVHPVESGYWQIADAYTAFFKAHAND